MATTIAFILVLIALIGLALFLSNVRMKRALRSVIETFRENNALNEEQAKTAVDLGIKPQSVFERLYKTRDYKPYALQVLAQAQIIETTEDGRHYLLESKLAESKLKEMVDKDGV